jgi:hypothetical protein
MYDKLRKELVNSPIDNPSGKFMTEIVKREKTP